MFSIEPQPGHGLPGAIIEERRRKKAPAREGKPKIMSSAQIAHDGIWGSGAAKSSTAPITTKTPNVASRMPAMYLTAFILFRIKRKARMAKEEADGPYRVKVMVYYWNLGDNRNTKQAQPDSGLRTY